MYANRSQGRAAYVGNAIETASPARLLVMLCERLVLDIERAIAAQQADDHLEANKHLIHAQDIVLELSTSLRPEVFEGGPALLSIYSFLRSRLIHANLRRDRAAADECLTLATQICDTWRAAALQAAAV